MEGHSAETATSTGTPLLSAAADRVGVTNLERRSAKGAEGWAIRGLEGKGLTTQSPPHLAGGNCRSRPSREAAVSGDRALPIGSEA
jgi:hypothetical protein